MKFSSTPLPGVMVIELEPRGDERGSFARTFCEKEFASQGLVTHWPQMNLSRNTERGTIRGMHFQADPHGEVKVVRCTRGAVFDVCVDVRQGSATFGRWFGVELSARAGNALYIPLGFAHGFQTLEPDAELHYLMSAPYVPGTERGVRFDDPKVAIAWPLPPVNVAPKDLQWPAL